jgi:subtilisin family serine protease
MKKNIITLLLSTLVSLMAFAQNEKNWIEGELLVQLTNNSFADELARDFSGISLSNAKLLGPDVNIWKFEYDSSQLSVDQAIESLYASDYVVIVQRNHLIKYRATVPNDSLFGQQWQYVQANDRDIDADLAWDVTTGGVSPEGDTIVICIIDDGVFLSHPDFEANLWVNRNEIPNNNIDDDGNGYVDDVRGWNSYSDNDNVNHFGNFEGHGSSVAGIVGARGNNGKGVSGVNWQVKMMIVKGGGDEAEAIAAYSYALANRKLYNASNGAQGAFVVATNASWGVDSGQASSAPIWCAMYDTLGAHGILNVGATANLNIDIDIVGDLPTQCPSDYLITVTNTNQADTKVRQAGYGKTTIDLGAPGQGTFTISDFQNNSYNTFGGTSGATPHVTGTIGLLYSSPCLNFASLAKRNPALAALKAKEYILNGTDLNSTLSSRTVSRGRLNINNAVQNLMADCVSLSIESNASLANDFIVYPNPLQGNSLQLSFSSQQDTEGELVIYNISGSIVHQQGLKIRPNENDYEIFLPSELPNGIYSLVLNTNTGSVFKKIVK